MVLRLWGAPHLKTALKRKKNNFLGGADFWMVQIRIRGIIIISLSLLGVLHSIILSFLKGY